MAFVLSRGQITSISYPSFSRYTDTGSIRLYSDLTLTYAAMYRKQPALRNVIDFLARQIASLPIGVYSGGLDDQDRERDRTHPLEKILRSPLPLVSSKLTKFKLIRAMVTDYCIWDRAFWLKLKGEDGLPGALLPIPSRMVHVSPENEDPFEPQIYRINGSKGWRDVEASNLVVFGGYNPDDHRVGVSRIETLRAILAEEFSAQTYRAQLWRNGARFSGYISRPLEARRWDPKAQARFQESWKAQYQGDAASWIYGGGTPVLEDGMKFVPAGVTPREAQYIESRKLTREECAVAYHLPPSSVGIYDSGSSHNAMESQRESLYRDSLPPWLVEFQQDIDRQLLYDIDPDAADGSKYTEFNLDAKLEGAFAEKYKVIQMAVGAPVLTRNEGRKLLNLGKVDGGDELITPKNVSEGGLASPADTAPDNPDNEASNDPKALPSKPQPPAVRRGPDPAQMNPAELARVGESIAHAERSILSKIGATAPVDWDRFYGMPWLPPGVVDEAKYVVVDYGHHDKHECMDDLRGVFNHWKERYS